MAATTAIKAGFWGAATAATAAAVEPLLEGSIVADVTDVVLDGSFAHLEAESAVAEVAVVADAATGAMEAVPAPPPLAAVLVEGSFFSAVSRSDALKAVARGSASKTPGEVELLL